MVSRKTLLKAGLVILCSMTLMSCSSIKSKETIGPLPKLEHAEGEADLIWKHGLLSKSKQYARLEPKIDGDILYAADHKGKIVAINKNTGKTIWSIKSNKPISAGPSVVGQTLLVGTGHGEVLAYNKTDGQRKWRAGVPSEVLAPPNGNTDILLVNTVDGKLTALDYETGVRLWIYDRSPPVLILRRSATPQIVGDIALAGFANGKVVALSKDTGSVLWERQIAVPKGRSELHRMVDIALDPVVEGDRIYVGSLKGNVSALSLYSGNVLWEKDIPAYQNLAVESDVIYLTDTTHTVWALEKNSGSILWQQDKLTKRPLTAPVVASGMVVVADSKGVLYWLDQSTGKLVGYQKVVSDLMSEPVISDNKLYLQGQNGTLAAVKIKPGKS